MLDHRLFPQIQTIHVRSGGSSRNTGTYLAATRSQITRRDDDRELQTEQRIVGLPAQKLQPDRMDARSWFGMTFAKGTPVRRATRGPLSARLSHCPRARRGTAVHSSEPCRSGKVGAAMGERAAVEIKRSGAAANLRRISRQAKTRVTEVTWLPAPELQHFRGFRAAVGVTHASRLEGYHGYHDGEKGNPVTRPRISGLPRRGWQRQGRNRSSRGNPRNVSTRSRPGQ